MRKKQTQNKSKCIILWNGFETRDKRIKVSIGKVQQPNIIFAALRFERDGTKTVLGLSAEAFYMLCLLTSHIFKPKAARSGKEDCK